MALSSWFDRPYPESPGFKEPDTSKAAADSVAGRATHLQRLVLDRLAINGPCTADEVAAMIGESILSIRPRLTELLRMGKIEDSGIRRPNSSGRNAKVWRII